MYVHNIHLEIYLKFKVLRELFLQLSKTKSKCNRQFFIFYTI